MNTKGGLRWTFRLLSNGLLCSFARESKKKHSSFCMIWLYTVNQKLVKLTRLDMVSITSTSAVICHAKMWILIFHAHSWNCLFHALAWVLFPRVNMKLLNSTVKFECTKSMQKLLSSFKFELKFLKPVSILEILIFVSVQGCVISNVYFLPIFHDKNT